VPADLALVEALRAALAAHADPAKAAEQQRYMKSAMPYYGLGLPLTRSVTRPILRGYAPPGRAGHEATVRALWDGAGHREEWYVAIALARHRAAAPWQDVASLDLCRHLVVTGAWWDVVDEIAAHLVGGVLAGHRAAATPILADWARGPDLWLRRTAVLAQLRHGRDTDTDFLRSAIEANVADSSFWLRKATGWALRQYARTDPDWVRAEVARLGPRLAPLSRREALKHLR
jgi:3-methyladenine DNA glycosylase AlkD